MLKVGTAASGTCVLQASLVLHVCCLDDNENENTFTRILLFVDPNQAAPLYIQLHLTLGDLLLSTALG